jgi:anti-sigma factor RsiW
MNATMKNAPEREEIESLLPWYAAGTLSRRDTARVEDALSNDAELARRFEMVREELGETIRVNESLGAPSARAMKALFEKIDAEPERKPAMSFNLMGRVSEFMSSFSPRTLAYAGGVAVLALVLQAGVITNLVSERSGGQSPGLASAPTSVAVTEGVQAMVRFAPQANAAEITAFLAANNAMIVGSTSDGTFRLLVPGKGNASEIVKKMSENNVVSSVLPVGK